MQAHALAVLVLFYFICCCFCEMILDTVRVQKAEAANTSKSSVKPVDRHVQSSCDTVGPVDMDSCLVINDETIIADKPSASMDRSLNAASKPSAVGSVVMDSIAQRAAAENAHITETVTKSTSRLFDLVNADSPVSQVSL